MKKKLLTIKETRQQWKIDNTYSFFIINSVFIPFVWINNCKISYNIITTIELFSTIIELTLDRTILRFGLKKVIWTKSGPFIHLSEDRWSQKSCFAIYYCRRFKHNIVSNDSNQKVSDWDKLFTTNELHLGFWYQPNKRKYKKSGNKSKEWWMKCINNKLKRYYEIKLPFIKRHSICFDKSRHIECL